MKASHCCSCRNPRKTTTSCFEARTFLSCFAGELLHSCDQQQRCQLRLSCKAYGVLPFSKSLIMAEFEVTVTDDLCWTPSSNYFMSKMLLAWVNGSNTSTIPRCREKCRADATCAAIALDAQGNCHKAVLSTFASSSNFTWVRQKVTDCDPFQQCLFVSVPGAAFMSGQFCPVAAVGQRPIYKKEGFDTDSTLYLHEGNPREDSCGIGLGPWVLHRGSDDDYLGPRSPAASCHVKHRVTLIGDCSHHRLPGPRHCRAAGEGHLVLLARCSPASLRPGRPSTWPLSFGNELLRSTGAALGLRMQVSIERAGGGPGGRWPPRAVPQSGRNGISSILL